MSLLLDLIYPPRCTFCHTFVDRGSITVCENCRRTLPFTEDGGRQKADFVAAAVAPLYYEKDVQESLHRFKFSGCTGYAKVYAPYVADCIQEFLSESFDVLSWIPVSRKRLRKRGYDQAELLAREVGKLLGLEPVPLLKKIRDTPPQSITGDGKKRRENVWDAYRVFHPVRVEGKRILLLDDIFTTGATVGECARMLGLAGAEAVYCATVARSKDI